MFIQKKLFGDKDIAAMSIKVETNNGTVTLSGEADNKEQVNNAISIAKSVTGVIQVKSSVSIQNKSQ
jgi:osmotically-inducible protein OsmY